MPSETDVRRLLKDAGFAPLDVAVRQREPAAITVWFREEPEAARFAVMVGREVLPRAGAYSLFAVTMRG